MTRLLKKILLLLLVAAAVPTMIVVVTSAAADYAADIEPNASCPPRNGFQLAASLTGADASNLGARFSHAAYLDSADWCSPASILRDLQTLDTLNPDSTPLNRALLIEALTVELEKRVAPRLSTYQPDSLIRMLHWAGRLHDCAEVLSKPDARVFRIVSQHWINWIANRLSAYAEAESAIKYHFKFKYMVGVCQTKGFFPPLGNSNSEKVLNYFIEQRFGYLFHRFWHSTGWAFKALTGLGLALLLYAFRCLIIHHWPKTA